MRSQHLIASVLASMLAMVLATTSAVFACGDKFFVPSRGARFRPRVDRSTVAVLVYAPTGSRLVDGAGSVVAGDALQAAGYGPVVVTTRPSLAAMVTGRRWDVLILDVRSDADLVLETSSREPPSLVLVTVGKIDGRPSGDRRHKRFIELPRTPESYVRAVDEAVRERPVRPNRQPVGAGE